MAFLYTKSFELEGAAPVLAQEMGTLQDGLQALPDGKPVNVKEWPVPSSRYV